MNGQLINSNSLNQMLTFKMPKELDQEFFPLAYGLGIFKIETDKGIAYMHSGDAVGYYANMLYFPADSTLYSIRCKQQLWEDRSICIYKRSNGKIISTIKQ